MKRLGYALAGIFLLSGLLGVASAYRHDMPIDWGHAVSRGTIIAAALVVFFLVLPRWLKLSSLAATPRPPAPVG